MKKILVKTRRLLKTFSILELLMGLIIILILLLVMIGTRSKKNWVVVEIKISQPSWWQQFQVAPPFWLGESIKVGDQEFNPQGKKIAEVINVQLFELHAKGDKKETRKDIFLTLKLLVSRDKRTKILNFKNRPLAIGSPIEISLQNTAISGVVTVIEGIPDEGDVDEIIVEGVWMNTFPWQAEIIPIGGKMTNGRGEVVAQILDKRIELAEKSVRTDDGRLVTSRDPLKRDVFLKVKLRVKKQKDNLYFLEEQKIKIGENIFIQLPGIDVEWISVMKIIDKNGKLIY